MTTVELRSRYGLKLVIHGPDLQVFVNRGTTPARHVQTLTGQTHGGIALRVGDVSNGDFANLVVR
jgi:hypothetical protein